MQGFAGRLERELRGRSLPQAGRATVKADGARKYTAWLGASAFAENAQVFEGEAADCAAVSTLSLPCWMAPHQAVAVATAEYCGKYNEYEEGGVAGLAGFDGGTGDNQPAALDRSGFGGGMSDDDDSVDYAGGR